MSRVLPGHSLAAAPRTRPRPASRSRRETPRVPPHRAIIHQRVRFGFALLAIGYLLLAGRLVYLQIVRHHYYLQEAARIRLHTFLLPAQRGSILDRNGVPLAVNVTVGDVIADPTAIVDPQATAQMLAHVAPQFDAVAGQQAIVAAQAKKTAAGEPLKFLILAKGIAYDQVQAFNNELKTEKRAHVGSPKMPVQLAGLNITTRQVRTYPNGDLAAQVVGFVNSGMAGVQSTAGIVGKYGIEKSMNAVLAGRDGILTSETDAQGRSIPGTETEHENAVSGQDVRLTIDSNIQHIAQEALAKSYNEHHAALGTVVVIDPSNGEILALASLPTFNPNSIKGTDNTEWHNPAVTDLYEPGSTLKTLTLSAVLDRDGIQHMYDHVFCNGAMAVGKYTIHCAKDPPLYGVHGDETMREVLENSCNIGAAQYALRFGASNLYDYEKKYGLLARPDTGLPGEQFSHLLSPDEKPWSKIQLANIAFGQGISMTPLQVTSVYATIANNGVLVHPHVVMNSGYSGAPVQTISPQVSRAMLSMLQSVVLKGTGKPAQIAGYNVGGKTGSAQVAEHGHYGDQYVGSFCGIAPITHPKLVVLCSIFKPVGVHWGAVVAAPVVHDILQQSLQYLKVPPDNLQMVDYSARNTDAGKQMPNASPLPVNDGDDGQAIDVSAINAPNASASASSDGTATAQLVRHHHHRHHVASSN